MIAILLLMLILVISITNCITTCTCTKCGPYTNGGANPNDCTCTFSDTSSCSYTLYGVVQASVTGITI